MNWRERVKLWSLRRAASGGGFADLIPALKRVEPDLKKQYSFGQEGAEVAYWDAKLRNLHAFQCDLMRRALRRIGKSSVQIVDIGDSAGTHMRYIRELMKGSVDVSPLSVNLDPNAVEKIKAHGLPAMLCRAEDLRLERPIDLFTCFETLEHLHNPAIFLRRLAKRDDGSRLVFTVPFVRKSRVGLSHVRAGSPRPVHAEEEHVFELAPRDWTVLALHAGWRVVEESVYRQYPRWPLVGAALARYWSRSDFEGFWGAVLERDRSLSDLYLDWEA